MKLCVGTSKGVVILGVGPKCRPLLALADPSSVWCMAQDCGDPNVIYAGAVDHVHMGNARGKGTFGRSTDGGRTWADITPGSARNEDVWAVAAAPDRPGEVFIGTSHARLLRSSDQGRTFRECAAFLKLPGRDRWSFPPPPHVPHVRSIVFDPHDSGTIYVGVEEGGFVRSHDRGTTFELLTKGIDEDVHCIAADPDSGSRLYAATGKGLHVSINRGASWRRVTSGLSRPYTVPLFVAPGEPATVYTAAAAGPPPLWSSGPMGANALMFRSIDSGVSFQPIGNGTMPERAMIMRFRNDPESDGGFFAVTTAGSVIRIGKGGENVTTVADRLPPAFDLVTMP